MNKILNDGEFENKVVIVTGAASGIGRASVLRFADLGVDTAMTLTGMTEPAIQENPEIESILGERQPIGRMATAEEIANTAVWLCSDQASYITGQAIAVDGGLTAV